MKKILCIVAVVMMLAGCEVISENERLIPLEVEETELRSERSHLLIEYTGFKCVNCPTAAEVAHAMQETYGERLLVVAMHPQTNPFTNTKKAEYDYTCAAADSCYLFMGGTKSTPFPTGNLDIVATEGEYMHPHDEWPALLTHALHDTVAPYMAVEAEADSLTRLVTVTIQTAASEPMECRLAIWLTEDSVSGAQRMPDGSDNMHYYHRHMLRTTAEDGVWGTVQEIDGDPATQTRQLTVPERCDIRHCAVVALLLHKDDYHVLQTKQTNIQLQ